MYSLNTTRYLSVSSELNISTPSFRSKNDEFDGKLMGRAWRESPAAKEKRKDNQRRLRLNTEFLDAIESEDLNGVIRSLDLGANVDAVCATAQVPALFIAVVTGNVKILQNLLSRKCQPCPLARHIAAWADQLECLKILDKIKEFNQDYFVGDDPFQFYKSPRSEYRDSSYHNHEGLKKKMPVKLEKGSTPLHIASANLSIKCVRYLLENGADINARDHSGMNPLDVVGELRLNSKIESKDENDEDFDEDFDEDMETNEQYGETLLEVVKSLLEAKARPTINQEELSKSRTTCLHTAVEMRSPETIRLLVEAGATLYYNLQGMNPVHWAIHHQNEEELKTLLELFKSPDTTVNISVSSSQSSLTSGSSATMSAVDYPTHWGNPPLHQAVSNQWLTGVLNLLEAGADITLFNRDKQSVLHLAVQGSYEILSELLDIVDIRNVLEKQDIRGATPLLCAVSSCPLGSEGPSEIVAALLNIGAKTDVRWPNSEFTVLHRATEARLPGVLRQLLNSSSTSEMINSCDQLSSSGLCPLHIAAQNGYQECAAILLEFKADVTIRTQGNIFHKATPLHLAATEGHMDTTRVIAQASRDLELKDHRGLTALHCAAHNGHRSCISVLLEEGADLSEKSKSDGHESGVDAILSYVPRPVELLEEILDSRIRSNGLSFNDRNCKISLDYALLEPRGEADKMRVIHALITSGNQLNQQRLLIHPLIQSYLYLKWQKMQYFFYVFVFIYALYLGTFTAFVLNRYYKEDAALIWYFNSNVNDFILWISLGILLFQESLFFYNLPKYYLMELESWHKLISFTLSIISISVSDNLNDDIQWPRDISSVAVLLAWTELMILASRMPSWGYHVLMFSRVAENVFKIFLTFSFLLIGFSLAFLVQFRSQGNFSSIFLSIIKTIAMSEELDYNGTFGRGNPGEASPYVGRLVLLMFILLVGIVLMNLLVGMAVSDISILETKGKTTRWIKRANFLNILEVILYNTRILKCLPPRIRKLHDVPTPFEIFPGRPRGNNIFKAISSEIREAILEKVKTLNQNSNVNEIPAITVLPPRKSIRQTLGRKSLSKALNRMTSVAVGVTAPSATKTSLSKATAPNDFLALWFQSTASSMEAVQRICQAMKVIRPLVMNNPHAREHFDQARIELRHAINQLDLDNQ